jgi:hypothetical protein
VPVWLNKGVGAMAAVVATPTPAAPGTMHAEKLLFGSTTSVGVQCNQKTSPSNFVVVHLS